MGRTERGPGPTTVHRAGPNLSFVRTWWLRYWLPVWFLVIAAIRLASVYPARGVDATLYINATRAFLAGTDPWQVNLGGLFFAAPPTTLVVMVPFAVLPDPFAVWALLVVGLLGSIGALRVLRLPLWWLAFPPLVDAMWMGNPQTLLLPLLVSSWSVGRALAVLAKSYAAIPMLARLDARGLVVAAALGLVTWPFLPWGAFLGESRSIGANLLAQAGPGMSAWAFPVMVPIAIIGLALLPRERAGWLAVPALWPATQWYYSALAIPGATSVAAALLAVQLPGLPGLVPLVAALELGNAQRFVRGLTIARVRAAAERLRDGRWSWRRG